MISRLWSGAGRSARIGLSAGAALIAAAFLVSAYFMLRTGEALLFGDLSERELASLVAELERMKVPFRVGPDGASLWVAEPQAQGVRLKLAGRETPLHGGVGLELFGQGDFGMTDFAQRVNYQRALQGELARTLTSLEEVRDARVHVALPEDGLFRRNAAKAKASVTLSMKPGRALRPSQVIGIQRLVASAVPGVTAQDVVVIDQNGLPLARANVEQPEGSFGSAGRLDLKKELEQHLGRKATEVLERAVGAGKAYASVDVTLNMDAVRVTTEDVLPTAGISPDRTAVGVVVRERSSTRPDAAVADGKEGVRSPAGQREVEYQTGKRVEQVVVQPGAIRMLQVVAVVEAVAEDATQLANLERLLGAAVGASAERGDVVVVQSSGQRRPPAPLGGDASAGAPSLPPLPPPPPDRWPWLLPVGGLTMVAGVLAALGKWRRRRLSARERILMLQRMQDWLTRPADKEGQPPVDTTVGRGGRA